MKAYPVVLDSGDLKMVVVRGDHRVNEFKLRNTLGEGFRPAHPDEVAEKIGPPGFIGPVGTSVPVLLDDAVTGAGYVAGANEPDAHLRGVEPGRDFSFERVDVRRVEEGDTVGGNPIRIEPAIEIGNIFKLGTRYSEPLGATYLDENGQEQLIWMGSYGIGPARIAAAAIEQFADEQGISWPRSLAPFDVELVALGKEGSDERGVAEKLYEELKAGGLSILLDDRDASPGEKFADSELVGVPLRATVGRRTLEGGEVEVQIGAGARRARWRSRARPPPSPSCGRRSPRARAPAADGQAPDRARPLRSRAARDRRGRPAASVDAAEPDRVRPPRADPGVPDHRAELGERHRRAARGALRDHRLGRLRRRHHRPDHRPVQPPGRAAGPDRRPHARRLGRGGLLALRAAAALALAILAARELLMLLLGQLALRRGVDIRINWPGRLAVAPVMGSLFFAMCGLGTLGEVLLYVGLALALTATWLYVRDGWRELRRSDVRPRPSS